MLINELCLYWWPFDPFNLFMITGSRSQRQKPQVFKTPKVLYSWRLFMSCVMKDDDDDDDDKCSFKIMMFLAGAIESGCTIRSLNAVWPKHFLNRKRNSKRMCLQIRSTVSWQSVLTTHSKMWHRQHKFHIRVCGSKWVLKSFLSFIYSGDMWPISQKCSFLCWNWSKRFIIAVMYTVDMLT